MICCFTAGTGQRSTSSAVARLAGVLEDAGISYWIDSGSLLTLKRDGELKPDDSDIDIGIFVEDVPRLNLVTEELEVGHAVQSRFYKKMEYKRKHIPSSNDRKTIDVNIYRRSDTHVWCPTATMVSESTENTPVSRLVPTEYLDRVTHVVARKAPIDVKIDRVPYTMVATIGTWWFPKELLEDREYDSALETYVPANWERYLEYRYGDWRVPVEEWSYWNDDDGIEHREPTDLL